MSSPGICLLTTSYPRLSDFDVSISEGRLVRGKFVHDMARGLVRRGFRVFVVTNHVEGEPVQSTLDGVEIRRFHYFVPGFETLTAGSGIPENIRKFKNQIQVPFYFLAMLVTAWHLVRTEKLGFINAHWVFPTGFIGWLLKSISGRPLIITAYGAELFPILQGKMRFARRFIRRAVKNADIVAGISPATVDAVKKLSGRSDILCIPDGIDTEHYSPGSPDGRLLDKYDLRGKRVVFFTGRMVTRKGHKYLLEAMREVSRRFPDVVCLLGGDGPLFGELDRLRGIWGIQASVRLPGFIPEREMVSLLRAATVYVLPSCVDANGDTEGSATSALEAMSCGSIALVSSVGGNIGAIEIGRGADYFSPGDSLDLARQLILILSMDSSRDRQWRKWARAYVMGRYEWDVVINNYFGRMGIEQSSQASPRTVAATRMKIL